VLTDQLPQRGPQRVREPRHKYRHPIGDHVRRGGIVFEALPGEEAHSPVDLSLARVQFLETVFDADEHQTRPQFVR